MKIAVIGLNHNTASAQVREKVAFTDVKKIEIINSLLDKGIEEVVLLSTCNRSEVYICTSSERMAESIEQVKQCYNSFLNIEDLNNYIYTKIDIEAIYHTFRVAAGLDSIVLGEDQILGQVKDAHSFAMNLGSSKKILNKLFREAIVTAKKIKTELKISENSLSVSSIGVKFIKEKIGTYQDKNVLIIGLGKMGQLTLKYLLGEKVNKIYMANRNHQKVIDIVKEYPEVIPVNYKDRYEILEDVEVLISATASPHVVIKAEEIKPREKALYIMDMAIPRDVDTNAANVEGVYLYNVDDLKSISDYNEKLREELSSKAESIIEEDIEELKTWMHSLRVAPVIKSLKGKCDAIEADTLEYIYRKVELDNRDKKIVEKMLNSALKRLIREPILKLKEIEDSEQRKLYIKVLEDLFDIDLD